MRLDPEESVMADDDKDAVLAVAKALMTEDWPALEWIDLPGTEQQRFVKKARAFLRAWKAAAVSGLNPNT